MINDRDGRVVMRMNPDERAVLKGAADRVGLPLSTWCRTAALAASRSIFTGGDGTPEDSCPVPVWLESTLALEPGIVARCTNEEYQLDDEGS